MRSSTVAAALPIAVSACNNGTKTPPGACTVTNYSDLAGAVANCTNIVLQDLYAPANSSIDLTDLKNGSTVTFAGTTVCLFMNTATTCCYDIYKRPNTNI